MLRNRVLSFSSLGLVLGGLVFGDVKAPEIKLQILNTEEGDQIVDVVTKADLVTPSLSYSSGEGRFYAAVEGEQGEKTYRLQHVLDMEDRASLKLKFKADDQHHFQMVFEGPTIKDSSTVAMPAKLVETTLVKSHGVPVTERAAALVALGVANLGRRVGGGDCYAFVRGISGGSFGKLVGSLHDVLSGRLVLSPGQILHMQNFNFSGVHGSNHYGMVEKLHEDGSFTMLHQNMSGRTYVVRNRIHPGSMSGSLRIYQP